ncbi:MAG: hypothetical protein K2K90_05250 [Lachnospiraceae bacterium]|nr:hypothetical protein [Lachnospiraceae bacterium]
MDTAEREIHAIVKEGEYSYKPVAPQCRRNSEHLDYVVADVRVVAGAIKITQANITDTRLSTELCGIAFPFWKLDTQAFFVQLNSFYNEFVAKANSSYQQFQGWQKDKKAEIEAWKAAEEKQTDDWQAAEAKQTDDWQKKETDDFTEWADNFISEWENWINGKIAGWSEEIMDWFHNLRDQLTDNAEVHLQEQIGNLANLQTDEKGNLVAAVNSALGRITSKANEILSKAVKKAGDTMTGALNLANGVWNRVGDDVYIGDHNVSGNLCIKGANSDNTGITFYNKNESANRRINLANSDRFDVNCGIQIAESAPTRSLGGTYFLAQRTDTGKCIALGVGDGGTNRGIYDKNAGNWMIYRDGSNVTHFGANVVNINADGSTTFTKGVTALKYKGNGDEIEVNAQWNTEKHKLLDLKRAAFTAALEDMQGSLASIGRSFSVNDGSSIEIPFLYNGGSEIGPCQWLLFIKVRNASNGALFGATLRLISTPELQYVNGERNPTGNVNIVSLGGTSNTGYTLTAGVEKITVKASAGKRVQGGICILQKGF